MKLTLLLLFFTIHLHSYSQQKDRRKYIGDNLNTRLFAVSDEGKIIVAKNNSGLYISESIDSIWKECNFPKDVRFNFQYENRRTRQSVLFSKNNQILMDLAVKSSTKHERNYGFVHTNDNGKSWKFIPSPNNLVFLNIIQVGNDVLHGYAQFKSRLLFFTSTDFGKTWKKQKTNFKSRSTIVKIQNDGNGQGILVLDNDNIYVTNSNWKKSKQIKTEEIFTTDNAELSLGSGEYKENIKRKFNHFQVKEIGIMNEYYVMLFLNVLYYSNKEHIEWKAFPYNISSIDLKDNQLVLIANKMEVFLFNDLKNRTPIRTFILNEDNKSYNAKLIQEDIYFVSYKNVNVVHPNNNVSILEPYLDTIKIEKPEKIVKGDNLYFAFEDKQLFISEDKGISWYSETSIDFDVLDFSLINDSSVLFQNKNLEYFEYSLKTKELKKSELKYPISTFLDSPLKSMNIKLRQIWLGKFEATINCTSKDESTFLCTCDMQLGDKKLSLTNEISIDSVEFYLNNLNENKLQEKYFRNFPFSESEVEKYQRAMIDKYNSKFRSNPTNTFKYYYSFHKELKKINDSLPQSYITISEPSKLEIKFVNNKNDTLRSNNEFSLVSFRFIPWYFKFERKYTFFYDIYFTHFILSCFPEEIRRQMGFTNVDILEAWADYHNPRINIYKY